MTARRAGLVLAALHVALLCTLGGKYLLDRMTRPRVWAKTAPVDPEALFRGRYLRLYLEVHGSDLLADLGEETWATQPVELQAVDGKLVAVRRDDRTDLWVRRPPAGSSAAAVLDQPVALFVPDDLPNLAELERRRDLWVEVTVPRRGLPRPIQLGEERDGKVVPLD